MFTLFVIFVALWLNLCNNNMVGISSVKAM